jgi:hypothetical protein
VLYKALGALEGPPAITPIRFLTHSPPSLLGMGAE